MCLDAFQLNIWLSVLFLHKLYFLVTKVAGVNLLKFERMQLGKRGEKIPAPGNNQSKAVLFF